LSTVVFKYDWVFGPKHITVYTSEDGKTFTEAASKAIEDIDNIDDGNGCLDYTLTFDATTAKFLKVVAESYTELPQWHPGAGNPGFLFVDEVIVK
jgi:hexosaminidase